MTEGTTNGRSNLLKLSIAALGIVYGDIGTSPLYAVRICFSPANGLAVDTANILGILSLIFWSLFLLISVKYLTLIIRADNRGEGGVLALMALTRHTCKGRYSGIILLILGIIGAALLYGDGLITPVITVISAVEGLNTIAPVTSRFVLPISLAILAFLFFFQHRGTSAVGAVFGPIMVIWFIVMGVLGLFAVFQNPQVFAALNPMHGISFLMKHGWHSLWALSAVFLVLTGGEALYADMGHFGKRPIQAGWFFLVFPSVVLNYFGQGAHLLKYPDQVENLFYRIAPDWAMIPLLVLATVATIIASQAVISGAFSLTRQAVQLGLLPRVNIRHTSSETIGQIYVPGINWALFAGVILLLLVFRQSENLAGAYGIAVSGTMLITTLMLFFFVRNNWKWGILLSLAVICPFLVMNTAFCAANMLKIMTGGWITILIGVAVFILMSTWDKGHKILSRQLVDQVFSEELFLVDIEKNKPVRVPGVAVFLAATPTGIPRTLLHNFKHNKVIHEKVILLTVKSEEIPFVEGSDRTEVRELGQGFYRVLARYGFSEHPDIPGVLAGIKHPSVELDPLKITFFLGRETLLPGRKKTMFFWRKQLFAFLSRNAFDASKFFRIPPGRVVEMGIQLEV